MDTTLRRKLLTYLGGAAIALSPNTIDQTNSTVSLIPDRVMEEFLDDVNDENWKSKDLIKLVQLLVDSPSAQIRCHAASLLSKVELDLEHREIKSIMSRLARDEEPSVRETLAESVAARIGKLSELDRMQIILDWSLSSETAIRRHAANVMSHCVSTFGADLALDYLSNDESMDVRLAVVEASAKRINEDRDWYGEIIERLSEDESLPVRMSADMASLKLVDLV